MKLESLHIYTAGYGSNEHLAGAIKFSNANGNVELTLRQEHMRPVLEAVAVCLAESAKAVANDLTADVISASAGAIEDKS